jgi:hypothetical protein
MMGRGCDCMATAQMFGGYLAAMVYTETPVEPVAELGPSDTEPAGKVFRKTS